MTQSDAVQIVKGDKPDCSRQEITKAWQKLVNDGTIWRMEKRLTDMACAMLAAGVIERNAA